MLLPRLCLLEGTHRPLLARQFPEEMALINTLINTIVIKSGLCRLGNNCLRQEWPLHPRQAAFSCLPRKPSLNVPCGWAPGLPLGRQGTEAEPVGQKDPRGPRGMSRCPDAKPPDPETALKASAWQWNTSAASPPSRRGPAPGGPSPTSDQKEWGSRISVRGY